MASLTERREQIGAFLIPKAKAVVDDMIGVTWPLQEAFGAAYESFAPHYERTRDGIVGLPFLEQTQIRLQRAWERVRSGESPQTVVFDSLENLSDQIDAKKNI